MKKFIFCSVFLGLLFALPSLAATYYVDFDNGNDTTGDGSETSPYKTFAPITPSPGDIVNATGTYDSSDGTDISLNWTGTAENPITIQAWGGQGQPIIDGSSGFTIASLVLLGSYNVLDGFQIETPLANSKFGLFLSNADHITVQNCQVNGDSSGTYSVYPLMVVGSQYAKILNNIFLDGYLCQLVNGSHYSIISGNVIKNIYNISNRYGFYLHASNYCEFNNNFVLNNSGAGLLISSIEDPVIINNTFYNNKYSLESVGSSFGSAGVHLENNIFVQAGDGQTAYFEFIGSDLFSSLTADYNLFNFGAGDVLATGYADLAAWQASGYNQDANSQEADPLFASTEEGNENLHLTNTSPAIDAGTDVSAYDYTDSDIDEEARPYRSYEIGADERPVLSAHPTQVSSDPAVKKLDLAWQMDTTNYPVTGYRLNWGQENDLADGTATDFEETALTQEIGGLKAAKKYYTQVKALYTTDYATYTSDYSNIKEVGTKPVRVKRIKVINREPTAVKLRWHKQARVMRYVIWVYNSKYKKIKTITVKKKRSYVQNKANKYVRKSVQDLKSGKTYYVKIRGKKKINDEWLKGKLSPRKRFRTS